MSANSGIFELAIFGWLSVEPPITNGNPPAQLLVVLPRLRELLFQRIEFHDEVRVRREEPHLTGRFLPSY